MILVNGVQHDLGPLSVEELLDAVGIEPRGIAVAHNGEIVRRSEWRAMIVHSGDVVEIVTAAAGG